jgi:hypothetical protein
MICLSTKKPAIHSSLRLFTFILIFSGFAQSLFAQQSWREITSAEDLYESYPETVRSMLQQFDLEHPGMEKVKAAYGQDDLAEASRQLLDYYRQSEHAQEFRREMPKPTVRTVAEADTILQDVFTIQNVKGKVPYGEDGHRDWYYKGPNNDREWAWLSNRHSQILQVMEVFFETGNPKYAEYIDLFLRDFIIKSMPYPAVKSSTSVWRGLEVAARAKVWTRVFYAFINSDQLSPATKLLILSSLPEHAHYNKNFHGGNNWLTMEISALATVAAYFPEYQKSDAWMEYAIAQMTASMQDQVYADGVQTELTSHYHNVSLRNFELFQEICQVAEKPLPDFYNQTLKDMYHYIAHAVRPSGFRILNNDGDRGSDREIILRGAEKFRQPDWAYIVTNGDEGEKPAVGPSYLFPWAGHLISRSGFDTDAHWSFFDIGPWGSGHQHNDKLHLSVAAYGRDLLVDAGRFAYTGEVAQKYRPYARGSAGHNVLLVDGKGQEAGPTHAEAPVSYQHYKITDTFDYATGAFERFENVEGEVSHQRAVMYVRGEFWVVVDRLITDRPRQVDALWHWHPDNEVVRKRAAVQTDNPRGNLAVVPVSEQNFDIRFVEGQESPEIQGWYSPEYNLYEPNVASFYTAEINGTETIVWLLLPSEEKIPKVKTEILAETAEAVRLSISLRGRDWQLEVPFTNSEAASLSN